MQNVGKSIPKAPSVTIKNLIKGGKRIQKYERNSEYDSSFMSSRINKVLRNINEQPTPKP